jgi:hypothetical protein
MTESAQSPIEPLDFLVFFSVNPSLMMSMEPLLQRSVFQAFSFVSPSMSLMCQALEDL